MAGNLLNPNQQRRVATHLRMLGEDLADAAGWPELQRPGEPYDALREIFAGLVADVTSLGRDLALPAHVPPPLRRRVQAVAEMWSSAMEDLKAHQLRAYGRVHPDLATALDPRVQAIVTRLDLLADVAGRLPDR